MAGYTNFIPPSERPVAYVVRAEPHWRAVIKKCYEITPDNFKNNIKLVHIRFWGIRIPDYTAFRYKVDNSPEAIEREVNDEKNRKSSWIDSIASREPTLTPAPMGAGKKYLSGIIDVVTPHESDEKALERIRLHLEHEYLTRTFRWVNNIMES